MCLLRVDALDVLYLYRHKQRKRDAIMTENEIFNAIVVDLTEVLDRNTGYIWTCMNDGEPDETEAWIAYGAMDGFRKSCDNDVPTSEYLRQCRQDGSLSEGIYDCLLAPQELYGVDGMDEIRAVCRELAGHDCVVLTPENAVDEALALGM